MTYRSALIAVVALVCASYAQTFRGGVEGTVTDSSGAAIAQAQVTAKNADTGLVRSTQTDDQGFYFITELPLGEYFVTATKSGFRTATVQGIHVGVSARERVNVQLRPGEVKETVVVNEEVPLVETAVDNLGGTLDAKQVEQLPVNGRDFSKILTMVPGSTADPGAVSESPGSFGLFSINGNRGRSNNYLLDGTDMNDGYRNDPAINEGGVFGVPATILPLDAVAEFGILSGTEAEYGRNSGAIVNIVTKSGTNHIHGSGFEDFRNNHLDARNYFNTVDQPQDLFLNNQFGGSVGGPIVKDRTFFFASYEGQRERVGIPDQITIPTQALINAQPVTINPVIAKLLARNPWGVPLPAGNPASPAAATIQATNNAFNRLDSVIGKIDQHVGGKDLLTGRYFFGDSAQNFPLGLQQGAIGPGFNTIVPTRVQVVSLSYTHVISSNLLMEFRGGWNRFFETFTPQDASFSPASIGLDTVNSTNPLFGGLPQISISGSYPNGQGVLTSISSLGNGGSQPRGRVDTNWQYFTNLSYTKGKHNLKTGIEFRRTSINGFQDTHFRGVLKFGSLGDFLTGTVSGGGNESEGDAHRVSHQNNYGLYFQDNFRLTRRLTVNYGLRWDYFGVIHEQHDRFSIFDPMGAGSVVQVGSSGLPGLYPKDFKNFSPRMSFAYDLTGNGKTVVRAGFGLYYDAFSQDFFLGQAPYNCGFCPGPAYNAVPGSPSQILISSLPTLPTAPPVVIQSGVPVFTNFGTDNEVFSVDQRLRTPYVYEYNLNVQQQLSGPVALQVGYVGSAGRKLFRYLDLNQANPATGLVPYGNFSYINQFQSSATSSYNSLQAVLTMKSWHGLTSTVNYTWSHSIDNASDGLDFVPQASQPDDSLHPDRERGNSNFGCAQPFELELPL